MQMYVQCTSLFSVSGEYRYINTRVEVNNKSIQFKKKYI